MLEKNTQDWFDTSSLHCDMDEISRQVQNNGFYCLEGAVNASFLMSLQENVQNLIKVFGKRYFSLIHPHEKLLNQDNLHIPYDHIINNTNFDNFLKELSGKLSNKNIVNSDRFNILRVVTGEKTDDQSLKFHYDSTLITALIPIFIPDGEESKSGHLIAFPNSRKIRSSVVINIIEKMILQNKIIQKILPFFLLKSNKRQVLKLKPGNIYLFSGLQTFHSNYAVSKEFVRATLLCFYGNPYPDSKTLKWIKNKRHSEEDKNIGL